MDSWSRPSKSQATPAPYYLIPGAENTPYCKSCGRVIGQRKTAEKNSVSYCSSRCRSHKPGPLDRKIEQAFVKFLTGEEEIPAKYKSAAGDHHQHQKAGKKGGGKKAKGDSRVLVSVEVVEEYLFGESHKGQDTGVAAHEQEVSEGSVDGGDGSENGSHVSEAVNSMDGDGLDTNLSRAEMEARDIDGHRVAALSVRSGTRIRPPQEISEVNGSVGGEKGRAERAEETPEALEKRLQGQKKVKEREMVRCAARRGVVFGFLLGEGSNNGGKEERRKCEAVMLGKVVEPSFAKGDWAIRWREE